MLVQMSKLLGLSPVVGVVGRTSKVDAARALECDVVIDKSSSSSIIETMIPYGPRPKRPPRTVTPALWIPTA